MCNTGFAKVVNLPVGVREPPADVDIVISKREVFVEKSYLKECLPTIRQRRSSRLLDRTRAILIASQEIPSRHGIVLP
jgi:hypothetical protein